MLKYKINKTINLWIVEDYNNINNKYWEYTIFWLKISLENIENKNISKEKISEIIEIFNKIDSNFWNILKYEKFFKPKFESSFYYSERKKLAQVRVSEEVVNDKIYQKYEEIYKNFQKNIYFLKKHSERALEDLEKLSNILKTIRYLKYDLEKLLIFFNNFIYQWKNSKKIEILKNIKWEIKNIENFSHNFLSYYSKKSWKWEEIFKIALNPAILNTNTEINKDFISPDIETLEKEVKELEEKNNKNRKTKEEFLWDIDSYMNYILYEKWFFDKRKNESWYEHCKKTYNEISEIRKKLYNKELNFNNLPFSTQYICDFLNKNPIEFSEEIYFDKSIKQELLKQNLEIENDKKYKTKNTIKWIDLKNYNFVQINTLKYQLLWEKIELKKQNKDFQKLSKYITILKWEINNKLKKWEYWKFVKIWWHKAKTAQDYSQKLTELVNKQNFDKELKAYSHFWYIIRWNNRVFLYLLEKDKNTWFNYKKAKEEIEKYKDEKSDFTAHIFQSLTLKWLTKLAFIKQAFWEVSYNLINIFKQKSYAEKRNWKNNDTYKQNLKEYIQFLIDCIKSEKWKELFDYIKASNFKKVEDYKTLSEFEKDLLKYAYKIERIYIDIKKISQEKIYELDIVNRRFEKEGQYKDEKPELKRQSDISIFSDFLSNISDENNYENLRLLPEIKCYLNSSIKEESQEDRNKRKLLKLENKKNYTWYDIFQWQRFYRNKLKVSFLFEYNLLEIHKNFEYEKENYLKNTIIPNSKKGDFNIFWIDIWENEFATLWIYDKNLVPQDIVVNWKKEKIVDLTNLKVENWCIIKKDLRNSEKYDFFKKFYEQLVRYQIYLKDILNEIWNIEIKERKEYWELSKIITWITKKYIWEDKFDNTLIKKFFWDFSWLSKFLFDFIKNKVEKEIKFENSDKNYQEIFKQLEMMKAINFKDAFWANFVWVIKELFRKYPNSIIVFENLWDNKKYDFTHIISQEQFNKLSSKEANTIKSFWAYTWNYIFQSIFTAFSKINENWIIKQYVYFDKNITNSLKSQNKIYWYNWNIFWVDEYCTSKSCPVCNELLVKKENWNVKDLESNKLYWHWKWEIWEHNMHHCDNPKNCPDIENHISKDNKAKCDYHMKNNHYWFSFIKSWDDLATYNIAKKWLEFLTK